MLSLLLRCNSNEKVLEVNQLKSKSPIYILYNNKNKAVKIQIPLLFKLTNESYKKISFSSLEHKDFLTSVISASVLYRNLNDTLFLIKKSNYKNIDSKESWFVTLYTQHYLNENEKEKFNSLSKIRDNKQIIRNVDSFYKENKKTLNMLSYNDSIYIRIQQNNKLKTLSFPLKIILE